MITFGALILTPNLCIMCCEKAFIRLAPLHPGVFE